MKKILIVTLMILPALWAGMTWVASNKTEATFNNMLAQSNQKIIDSIPILTMEKQSFSKGFMSSTAKSIIHIDPEIFDYEEPLKITLDHTIYHGPLMLTADGIKIGTSYIITTLDQNPLEAKTQQALALIFAGKQPFISRTQTHFNNNITEFIDMPNLVIDSDALEAILESKQTTRNQNFKLSLAGISGELTTNPEANFLEGWMLIEALSITGKNNRESFGFTVNSSSVQFDIDELYQGAMLLGSVTFKLPEMQLRSGKQGFSMKDIMLRSSGGEEAAHYYQTTTLDIDKLIINADNSALILPASKLHISFSLKGLEQKAIKHLIDIGRSINKTQLSLLNSGGSGQVLQQLDTGVSNYLHALNDLIKPGLANNNLIELSNAKGRSSIHFDLSYVAAKKLLELKTLKQLIMALSAELGLNINKNLVAGTAIEQLLNSPMASNAIKSNAIAYTAMVTLDDGQLNLNGETISLLEQLGSAAEEPLDWGAYLQ